MNQIKFFKKSIQLGKKKYKGYLIGELPEKFAFIYDENKDQDGIVSWFNYKGLTYITD
jgi:hypothetical protein